MRTVSPKEERNLLKNHVGQQAYKSIVQGWSTAHIRNVMRLECENDELRRRRNNILNGVLHARRIGRA